jgi:hypothetical protein
MIFLVIVDGLEPLLARMQGAKGGWPVGFDRLRAA